MLPILQLLLPMITLTQTSAKHLGIDRLYVLEITTWPNHQNIFYRITSSAVMFDVKAPGNAAVGLARHPGKSCDYWVGIGDNNRSCWIKKDDENCKSAPATNTLNSEEYRTFWITWHCGNIRLGRDGETRAIVTQINKVSDLNYITFSVLGERNPAHWKFELPPVLEQPKLRKISDGKPSWVEAVNQLPDGALIGGYEKEPLYIIRSPHSGSLTPGKFVPSERTAYMSWGGDAHVKSEFEVLCGYNCVWVQTSEDRIPVGAVRGGYSEVHNEILYVGRAEHNGHLIPGKVQPSFKVCFIPFNGKEVGKKNFEILVEPCNMRCSNKVFMNEVHVENLSESDQEDNDWRDEEENVYDSNDEDYGF